MDQMQAGDVVTFTFTVLDRLTGLPVPLGQYASLAVLFLPPGPGAAAISITPTLIAGGAGGQCTCQSAAGQLATLGTWRAQVVGYQSGSPPVPIGHTFPYEFEVRKNVG